MYCKKCGTKQKEGQRFCPKCGTPFPVIEKPKSVAPQAIPPVEQKQAQASSQVNHQTILPSANGEGTPQPTINNQKTPPPPVDNFTEKVEETFEQGKKFIKEDVKTQFDKGVEKLKSVDWKAKANQATESIKHFDVKKMEKKHLIFTGIGCVVLFIGSLFFCLFLLIACNSCGYGNRQGNGNYEESQQEEFINLLDDPSTAFTVRIDNALGRNEIGIGMIEVPEGEGSKDDSYIWTLIFFPENDSKNKGRAVIEAWLIDRAAWAQGYTKAYRYEIREGIVELYNGSYRPSYYEGWLRAKDIRLSIEKEGDSFNLRGEFLSKERLFKQSQYIAAPDKNSHYINI